MKFSCSYWLLLLASSVFLACAHKFDASKETLAERLAAIKIAPPQRTRLAFAITKQFPNDTNIRCYQVDGKSGIEYRSCVVENYCFSLEDGTIYPQNTHYYGEGNGNFSVSGPSSFATTNIIVPQPARKTLASDEAILSIANPTLLFARYLADNTFHRLHDDFFPMLLQIAAWPELRGEKRNALDRLVMFYDKSGTGIGNELYSLLGEVTDQSSLKSLQVEPGIRTSIVCFKKAYMGPVRTSLWYNSGVQALFSPAAFFPATRTGHDLGLAISWLKKRLGLSNYNDDHNVHLPRLYKALLSGDAYPSDMPKLKLTLIARRLYRKIRNEDSIVAALKTVFPQVEIAILCEEDNNTIELIEKANESFAMIGVHGALLTMAAFMPSGSLVFEIMPYAISIDNLGYYKVLSELPGFDFNHRHYMSSEGDGTWDAARRHLLEEFPPSYAQAVRNTNPIPNFYGVSSKFWRYRMGQDVEIDPEFLIQQLKEMMSAGIVKSGQLKTFQDA